MEKIVKFCAICEESFAENFSFCPNCAAPLTAYEMNPLIKDDISNVLANGDDSLTENISVTSVVQQNSSIFTDKNVDGGSYHITFVDNHSSKIRQNLLLGAFLFVMSGTVLALIMSIYNADAYVAALDENMISVVYSPIDDLAKLEPEPEEKDNKDPSGGGNGGRNDSKQASKGDYANQSDKPLIAPTVTNVRVTNPEIKIQMETDGKIKRNPTDNPYGVENSQYTVSSDGFGPDGGQGNGPGRGQGPGKGSGSGPGEEGPGIGPGSGGVGGKNKPDPKEDEPPDPPKGVTVGLKIISKPRAIYTDAARRNQIAGTVTLRVTFMANGSIGNIVAIGGLPDGLTEQAIAAARNIQFEPAKRNGVPTTVTKQVQYTFTLY